MNDGMDYDHNTLEDDLFHDDDEDCPALMTKMVKTILTAVQH